MEGQVGQKSGRRWISMHSPKCVASVAITIPTASIGRAAIASTKLERELHSPPPRHNTDMRKANSKTWQ